MARRSDPAKNSVHLMVELNFRRTTLAYQKLVFWIPKCPAKTWLEYFQNFFACGPKVFTQNSHHISRPELPAKDRNDQRSSFCRVGKDNLLLSKSMFSWCCLRSERAQKRLHSPLDLKGNLT